MSLVLRTLGRASGIAALRRAVAGSRIVHDEIVIEAAPERVWREFTDFRSFPSWNPFIRKMSGKLVPGRRLRIKMLLGDRLIRLRPWVTLVRPGRELRWLARQPVTGLFDVERAFEFEPLGDSGTRFVQYEIGRGLLAPILGPALHRKIAQGYAALNCALKARAEDNAARSGQKRQRVATKAVNSPDWVRPGWRVRERGTSMRRKAMWIAALALPATAIRIRIKAKGSPNGAPQDGEVLPNGQVLGFRKPTWRTSINSHREFTHDSIDSLGYDWARIANPAIKPKFPLKIYLPTTTDEIVKVIKEAKAMGEHLTVRSKGHSSNDLVLAEGGTVLVTEKLNQILDVDDETMTATVQAGAVSAQLDDRLSTRGLGLPIIGDHNHITVGGFASVGGISPASHRFGLFVDTVQRLQYVNWDGELITCSRTEQPDQFYAVLTGRGQHGVIATITVKIIKVDKYGTVLKNKENHYWNVDAFITGAGEGIRNPGDAQMERGVWLNYPLPGGRSVVSGQFSAYHTTDQTPWAHARDTVAYNYLDSLGWLADHMSRKAGGILKVIGMVGVLFSPKYASMKNVEFFTDKVLDSMVGDPTRMFIILAPLDRFDSLFREAYDLMVEFRQRHKCFTFLSVYVKSIRSPYLAQGGSNDRFCELMFYNGINNQGMTEEVTEELVNRFDDIVIANKGFRYMHSLTSKDPERRRVIDPNVYYSARLHDTPAVEPYLPAEAGAPRRSASGT